MTATSTALRALTSAQQAFVDAYFDTSPGKSRGSQAAVKAGYARKGARNIAARMMRNSAVLACVQAREAEIRQRIEEKQGINGEWVIAQLVEVVKNCTAGEPRMVFDPVTKTMVHDGTWGFDSKGAVAALGLIGKSLGMFNVKPKGKEEELFNLTINLGEPVSKTAAEIANPTKPPAPVSLSEPEPQILIAPATETIYELPTINLG